MEIVNNPDEAIAWEPARDINRANWEERVAIHVASGYDLASFRQNPTHLSQVVKDDYHALCPHLPNSSIDGLKLCHLQCHIGTDTLSFARLGAHVTGVDFSPAALEFAAEFTQELGLAARWVETTYPPVVRYGYFPTGLAQSWDAPSSYAGDGTIKSTRTYEWPHSVSEIMTALLGVGLQIIAVDEGKTLP